MQISYFLYNIEKNAIREKLNHQKLKIFLF